MDKAGSRRYWTKEAIYDALVLFCKQHCTPGQPFTSTLYRTRRKDIRFPSHEVVRRTCGPWAEVQEEVERRLRQKAGGGS